jgi:DNA-binding transcriptional ArsR family regulator
MTSDDEIHSALLAIYSRLDVIEGKVTVVARADRGKLLDALQEVVDKQPLIGKIYLGLDGKKNQDDIVAELDSSSSTVSRHMIEMTREHGMIELVKGEGKGKIYRHNREMESVLHLTANIRKWLERKDKER